MAKFAKLKLQLEAAAIAKAKKNQGKINRLFEKLAKQYNLAQLNSGVGTDGKKVAKLTKDYRSRKSNSRERNRMISSKRDSKTEYAAKGSPNFGRLSGSTFSALKFKSTTNYKKTVVEIKLSSTLGRRNKIAEYLEKNFGATRGWHKKGQKPGKKTTYSKAKRFYYGVPTGAASVKRLLGLFKSELTKILKD